MVNSREMQTRTRKLHMIYNNSRRFFFFYKDRPKERWSRNSSQPSCKTARVFKWFVLSIYFCRFCLYNWKEHYTLAQRNVKLTFATRMRPYNMIFSPDTNISPILYPQYFTNTKVYSLKSIKLIKLRVFVTIIQVLSQLM